jgi:hypothetical protein
MTSYFAPEADQARPYGRAVFLGLTFGAPVAALIAILAFFLIAPPIGWGIDEPVRADLIWVASSLKLHLAEPSAGSPLSRIGDGLDFVFRDLPNWADVTNEVTWRLHVVYGAAVLGFAAVASIVLVDMPPFDNRIHHSGLRLFRGLAAVKSARAFLAGEIKKHGVGIQLAPGLRLSKMRELRNLLIVGAPDSGKTRIVLFLIDQILARVRKEPQSVRLMMHDTTGEIYRNLPLPEGQFAALHPHRAGGWAWAIGRDVRSTEDGAELAARFVGRSARGENRVFDEGAIVGLTGCFELARHDRGQNWSFDELFEAVCTPGVALKREMERVHPAAAALIEIDPETGGVNRTSASFILSFRAYVLSVFEPLSKAWRDIPPERRFSFVDWLTAADPKLPPVVVLSRSARHKELSAKWIGAVFDLIASHGADEEYNRDRRLRSYFVLDELHQLGRLDRLQEILDVGRNRGLSIIATYQDFRQARAAYGEEEGKSLAGRFATKIIGQMPIDEDSKYASDEIIGGRKIVEWTESNDGRKKKDTPEVRIAPQEYLAYDLGAKADGNVKAVVVGLGNIVELSWPETVWPVRR